MPRINPGRLRLDPRYAVGTAVTRTVNYFQVTPISYNCRGGQSGQAYLNEHTPPYDCSKRKQARPR